jgi:RNA polymerase sigma-70 factor (ECF subfamily)
MAYDMMLPVWFGGGGGRSGDEGEPRLLHDRQARNKAPVPSTEPLTPDEARLLSTLRASNQHALREIVDTYGPSLLTLAAAVTGSTELGDDVVQQVFIRLWDHRETLEIRGSLRQYLWRATRNQAISVRRHEEMHHRIARSVRTTPSVTNAGAAELDAAALLAQVMGVLQELPARCQEIFLLNWRDALTPAEIADALGVGVATVRNQILRAVKHLGEHFGVR